MAFPVFASPPVAFIKTLSPQNLSLSLATWNFNFPRPIQCKASYKVSNDQNQTISPRPSKFQPSIWTYDYIQSLSCEYKVWLFNTYFFSSIYLFIGLKQLLVLVVSYLYETSNNPCMLINLRIMLTGAPEVLVKENKKKKVLN